MTANSCFLIGKEKDEIGILIHSTYYYAQLALLTFAVAWLSIWFFWLLDMGCLKLNYQVTPTHLTQYSALAVFVLYSVSNWVVNTMLTWLFRQTGYSDIYWNQSKIVGYATCYATEKVCGHLYRIIHMQLWHFFSPFLSPIRIKEWKATYASSMLFLMTMDFTLTAWWLLDDCPINIWCLTYDCLVI